ncbi:MAG: stage II sporulation protein M [Bacillota bacterium]|nr:stage II sporulation protein M [Bacillota bacterium]
MRGAKLNRNVSKHFQESLWLYVVCLFCLFTGIVLGIYTVKYMGETERQDLINYFLGFKKTIGSEAVNNKSILIETVKTNVPMIAALWLLGLTIVGIPVILVIDIIKGFTLGFTLTFVFYSMSYSGVGFVLMGVLPQNIIYLPCIVIGSVLAIKLSLAKLKDKLNKQVNYHKNYFLDYSMSFLIIILVMMLGFLYEAYITPRAIQTVAFYAGSVYI